MNQKIFSNSVEDQSLYGTVTITYLDPFGTPSVSDLNGISTTTITPINPYWITIDPDYVYNQIDQISLHVNRNISGLDFVSAFDDIQSFDFIKRLHDEPISTDHIQSFDVTKKLHDQQSTLDFSVLSVGKSLYDIVDLIEDRKVFTLNKVLSESVNQLHDEITAFGYGKSLYDNQYTLDVIQSFSIIKVLHDYANPVDLVSIPDGSTFTLEKTLRNTVGDITDHASFTIVKPLDVSTIVEERSYLHVLKTFDNSVTNEDFTYFSFAKLLIDNAIAHDITLLDLTIVKSDIVTGTDHSKLTLLKSFNDNIHSLYDVITTKSFVKGVHDYQSSIDSIKHFNIVKSLKDYANPVDLVSIPDGSTFSLNKTIRNTVLPTDSILLAVVFTRYLSSTVNNFNEKLITNFVKALKDNPVINEKIKSFVIGKALKDTPTPIDKIVLSYGTKASSSVGVTEHTVTHFTKRIDDLYSPLLSPSLIVDSIQSINPHKYLQDSVTNSEKIKSFSVIKALKDYANPVDLVSIPDGSTFTLQKTINNFATANDNAKYYWNYVRKFNHSIGTSDYLTAIVLGKYFTEVVNSGEDIQQFVIHKTIHELNTVLEGNIVVDSSSLSLTKPFTETLQANDRRYLNITKPFSNILNATDKNVYSLHKDTTEVLYAKDANKLSAFKLLQDYANPVDLVSIPDGSTFVLNKTIRNTVNPTDNAKFYWGYNRKHYDTISLIEHVSLKPTKSLVDLVTLQDVTKLKIIKSFADSISAIDFVRYGRFVPGNDNISLSDVNKLTLFKAFSNIIGLSDTKTLKLVKNKSDVLVTSDLLKQFNITKSLYDYANPVDLVSIPDGSTFVLNKSLRNTVLPNDHVNLYWDFVRFGDSNQSTEDYSKLSITLRKNELVNLVEKTSIKFSTNRHETITTSDFYVKTLHKTTSEFISNVHDTHTLNVNKLLGLNSPEYWADFDFGDPTDRIYTSLTKRLSDSVIISDFAIHTGTNTEVYLDTLNLSDVNSKSITKVFNDRFLDPLYYQLLINPGGTPNLRNLDFEALPAFIYDMENPYNATIDLNAGTIDNIIYDYAKLRATKKLIETANASELIKLMLGVKRSFADSLNSISDIKKVSFKKSIKDYANPVDLVNIPDGSKYTLNKTITQTVSTSDLRKSTIAKLLRDTASVIDLINIPDGSKYTLTKHAIDSIITNDLNKKSFTKKLSDFVIVADSALPTYVRGGLRNDDSSIIEDSGYLRMTDYADITYFAEDYVGETRSFT